MKKINVLLVILLILQTGILTAQAPPNGFGCGTDKIILENTLNDPNYQNSLEQFNNYVIEFKSKLGQNKVTMPLFGPATYVIPVVVHVMHPSGQPVGTGNNILYSQIESQIDALNAAFAMQYGTGYPNGQSHPSYATNTEIQFCLARNPMGPSSWTNTSEPGVMRYAVGAGVYNTTTTAAGANALLGASHPTTAHFPFSNYLNIWLVNDIDGGNSVIGYAPTPIIPGFPLDGVVMRSDAFGDNSTGNTFPLYSGLEQGKVLAHEVGHYLHLFHIFQGGCSGLNAPGNPDACDLNGDFICDIEPCTTQNVSNCAGVYNTCTATYSTGTTSNDMIESYMSYADDNCMNTFTNDQSIRMWATLTAIRGNLWSVLNLSTTGVLGTTGCVAPILFCDISGTSSSGCISSPVTLSNPTAGNTATTWTWSMPGATPSTGSTPNVTFSYTTSGTYTVTLTVSDGFTTETCNYTLYINNCTIDPNFSNQCRWDFGQGASLTFAPPTANAGSLINSSEACASICDGNGSFLFYTNGRRIWDAANTPMTGTLSGSPNVPGSISASAGVVIVPDPGNTNRYYVFTTPDAPSSGIYDGLHYSIVDMTLNPPFGDILLLNQNVPGPTMNITEGVTAIPHCNGQDYWIIVQGASTGYNNQLVSYLVTPYGISNPVFSPAGYTVPLTGNSEYLRMPDANRAGTLYASATRVNNHIYIYNFDNSTGQLTSHTDISTSGIGSNGGISFSPNGDFLYVIRNNNTLYQYNITIPGTPVLATNSIPGAPTLSSYEALQLGPDNILYVGRQNGTQLAVVNNPDVAIPGEGFSLTGPTLAAGDVCRLGLPNEIDAIKPTFSAPTFTAALTSCATVEFTVDDCWQFYDASWDFGDGSPLGSGNPVSHTYAVDGNYTVTLTLSMNGNPLPPITQVITIYPSGTITISGPTLVCINDPFLSNYSVLSIPGASYSWSITGTGSIVGPTTGNSIDVDWTGGSSGTVSVIVTTPGCTLTATLNVTLTKVKASLTGSPLTICEGETSHLYFTSNISGLSFLWSTGETTNNIYVSPTVTTTYTVTITNGLGCSDELSITITVEDCSGAVECKFIDKPGDSDIGRNVVPTIDGGFTIVGDLNRSATDMQNYWLKYDASFVNQFNSTFGNAISGQTTYIYNESAYSVLPVEDGYLIIGTVLNPGADYDFQITKLSLTGTLMWRSRYLPSTGYPNRNDHGRKLVRMQTGGGYRYFAVGYTNSFAQSTTDYNAFVMQFDPTTGNQIAINTFGMTGTSEQVYDAIVDNTNSHILLAGETISATGNRDMLSYKVTSGLTLAGAIIMQGGKVEYANSITMIPGNNNDVFLAGSTSTVTGTPDIYVVRINYGTYTYSLSHFYFEGQTTFEWANCIIPVDDGTLTLCGETRTGDGILMNIDPSSLSANWSHKSDLQEYDAYKSVAQLSSGSYVITGVFRSGISNDEILRIIANNKGESCCRKEIVLAEGHWEEPKYIGTTFPGSYTKAKWGVFDLYFSEKDICEDHLRNQEGDNSTVQNSKLVALPNPNRGSFKIILTESNESISLISVYDITGNLIYERIENENNNQTIELKDIHSGIYLVVVKGSDDSVYRTTINVIR